MKRIRLTQSEWCYDPRLPLGPEGAFGTVYAGSGEGHPVVAVKKLKIEAQQAAHRELRIAHDLADRRLAYVIPVLDAGRDAESGSYFVVMARAEKSLEDELSRGRTWEDADAARVLLQITKGLSEVPEITHRDLKPANVLQHEGRWKVADFGIARFVEESTSARTLKDCLSPPYAAPEQWRLERSTAATDIYAVGCVGYALLTGGPPFGGPTAADFREQHLHEEPPRLEGRDPRLRSLLAMMLRKAGGVRPSLERVQRVLSNVAEDAGKTLPRRGFDALRQAGAVLAEREAQEEARRQVEIANQDSRACVAREALEILKSTVERMYEAVLDSTPAAHRAPLINRGLSAVVVGKAILGVRFEHGSRPLPENAFAQSGWDVILGATIEVTQARPRYKWSASLWYSNLGSGDEFRWWEVSYFLSPLVAARPEYEPFALTADFRHADEAAAPVVGRYQIAYGPAAIDGEEADEFFSRWVDLLAKASQGRLCHPRSLPL